MVTTKEIGMKRFIAVVSCFVLCGSAFAQVFEAPAPKKKSAPTKSVTSLQAASQVFKAPAPVLPPPSKATLGFYEAAKIRNFDVMEIYLAQGADVNCGNCDASNNSAGEGETLMLRGTKKGDIEMVQYLLARGADVNLANRKGVTPLMQLQRGVAANQEQYVSLLTLLLKNGARVDAVDGEGRNIVDYLPAQANFFYVGPSLFPTSLRTLMAEKIDINHKDSVDGTTLLMRLADKCASEKNLRQLLNFKPDFSLTNNEGKRAVDIALERATKQDNCNETLKVLSNPEAYTSTTAVGRALDNIEPEQNGKPSGLLKLTSGLLDSIDGVLGKKR
jgi:hypothetical protein